VNLHRTRRVGDWRELRGVRDLLCRELVREQPQGELGVWYRGRWCP
jgi:hypothetical protein